MDHVSQWRVGDQAPPPLPRRSEADVVARWQDGPPLVSVLCPTYQHVDFIEDALGGFLGQDTDFPFEVIVRDDASTDGTADIVRDYAERYPSIVRTILEPVNTFGHTKAFVVLQEHSRAPLIAPCEGDDYWLDPRKLQMQSQVLLGAPSIAVAYHASLPVADGLVMSDTRITPRRDISPRRLRREAMLSIHSLCFRSSIGTEPDYLKHITTGDRFLTARLGQHGSARFLHELLPAVYRVHEGGIWSMRSHVERMALRSTSSYWIGTYFADRGDRATARFYLRKSAEEVAQAHLGRGIDPRPSLALRFAARWPRTIVGRLLRRAKIRR